MLIEMHARTPREFNEMCRIFESAGHARPISRDSYKKCTVAKYEIPIDSHPRMISVYFNTDWNKGIIV